MPLECKPDLAARILIFTLLACGSAAAQQAALPPSVSEIPETFKPKTDAFDFIRREEMLPMRDGVKLKTIILVPKGAKDAPILLARTPYNAAERLSRTKSPKLASVVPQMMDTAVDAGYIIAYQDVRGKHGSEGDYVMTQPLRGPLNATATDHATDCYDTIEWLVKNVRESNGRVGTIGGSYEGYTTVMSTVNPHPALKAAVPFAPMVDGWMGDDWFHNGAFRAEGALEYTYNQQAKWQQREVVERSLRQLRHSGCAVAPRGRWRLRTAWSRPASGGSWRRTRLMTPGGRSRRSTGCSRKSRSPCR